MLASTSHYGSAASTNQANSLPAFSSLPFLEATFKRFEGIGSVAQVVCKAVDGSPSGKSVKLQKDEAVLTSRY